MSRKTYPSDAQDRFLVRLPDGMREHVVEEARKNVRSMNGQIVWMLQQQIEATKAQAQPQRAA